MGNGDLFFDHFPPDSQNQVLTFLNKISQSHQLIEDWLCQKCDDHLDFIHYRGKFINGNIQLVGQQQNWGERIDGILKHKQQMESVSYLSAGFAHELRNPLSVIKGFIQLSALTGDIDKYYQTITSEIDRMNGIIDDFLSLSRKSPKKAEYQPHELFESLVSLIRAECLLQSIELDCRFEPSNRQLSLNKSMIKQIILNLLRNSIEAFEENQKKRHFYIYGTVDASGYKIEVSDNGPGMKQEVIDQLGKPFFTTKESGTGIGIPLCKKIVLDHGGQFHIDSTLGQGTTVTLFFPFSKG